MTQKTATQRFGWNNTGPTAEVSWDGQGTSGSLTITIKDAANEVVFFRRVSGTSQEDWPQQSDEGTPGRWTVGLSFTDFSGRMALSVAAGGPVEKCPGHWHSSFTVIANGERVNFTHRQFQFEYSGREPGNTMPMSSHIHRGTDYEWHWEPAPSRCLDFGATIAFAGMTVSAGELVLEGAHAEIELGSTGRPQAGVYRDDGERTLRIFTQQVAVEWHEIPGADVDGWQPQDGERTLILYGDYDAQQVKRFQDSAPPPPSYVKAQQAMGNEPDYPRAL